MTQGLAGCQTLLVRCPNWVGDVVMATPVFDCLRENLPGVRIVGIAKRNAQGIVRDGPWFDDFVDLDDKTWKGISAMARAIRGLGPDAAILLPNSFRSLIPVWMGGVRRIFGYQRQGRGLLVSGPSPLREGGRIVPMPMEDYYLEICRWLGLTISSSLRPRLFIGSDLERAGQELLTRRGIEKTDRVIGLNPGASFGQSKCWPAQHFARTAELLAAKMKSKILLFVGPGEDGIAQAIVSQSQASIIDTTRDRVDLSLLKPLIQRCQLLVTNDTGPRHYAVALGVPTVVLMGPTDPRYTASNLEKTLVLRNNLPCSPCHLKVCPTDHRCMTEISPESVLEAAQALVGDAT